MGPLHDAALMGKLEDVKRLIREEGRDINERNAQGDAPLHRAACSTRGTPVLEWLLQQEDVEIDAVNHEGRSALHASFANAAHVKMLLKAGADPTIKEKRHPHTPFLHAVMNGYNDAVKELLADARVDVHASDGNGQGALALCVSRCTTDYDLQRLSLLLDPALSRLNPMLEGPSLLRGCRAWVAKQEARRAAKQAPASTATNPPVSSLSSPEPAPDSAAGRRAAAGRALERQREALTHKAIAILEGALARRDLAYHLCRARAVVDAEGVTTAAAAPACLKGRVGAGAVMPKLTLSASVVGKKEDKGVDGRYMAVLCYALGLDPEAPHLPSELFEEIKAFLMSTWGEAPGGYASYSAWVRERKRQREAEAAAAAAGAQGAEAAEGAEWVGAEESGVVGAAVVGV